MRPAALFLFNRTRTMPAPWLDAGYECWCVDTQHPPGITQPEEGLYLVGCDVRDFSIGHRWAFIAAFPPCTHLAVSGSGWMKAKGLPAVIEALQLVNVAREICEASGAPYMIENPVSTLSTYWREPDYIFDPCDYGDAYTKKTCLWTGNGFVMPPKVLPGDMFAAPTAVEPVLGSKMHLVAPGPERANIRSETPRGFACAVFEANHRLTEAA